MDGFYQSLRWNPCKHVRWRAYNNSARLKAAGVLATPAEFYLNSNIHLQHMQQLPLFLFEKHLTSSSSSYLSSSFSSQNVITSPQSAEEIIANQLTVTKWLKYCTYFLNLIHFWQKQHFSLETYLTL